MLTNKDIVDSADKRLFGFLAHLLRKNDCARLRKIAFGYDEDSYEERYYCSEEFKNCRKCYRYAPKELEGL